MGVLYRRELFEGFIEKQDFYCWFFIWTNIYYVEVAVYMLKLYISSPRIETTIYICIYIIGVVIKCCSDCIEMCHVVCGPTGLGLRWREIINIKRLRCMYVPLAELTTSTRHLLCVKGWNMPRFKGSSYTTAKDRRTNRAEKR